MEKKYKVGSFFSGIGGFDLGFEKMGFEIVYQCEVNDFCTGILSKHWPKMKIDNDISQVNPDNIPEADIWCGGFPCQDVSVARGAMGRDGLKGKNSSLFYSFFSLIKAKQPEVILIENVTGLLSSHNGTDFKIVLESLTSIGYGVSWRVLNSRYFGVPQSRPRVYICAWKNDLEKAVFVLNEYEASVKKHDARQGFLNPNVNKKQGITVPEVSYCLAATSGRHTGTDWSRTYVSYFDRVRRLTPSESERLQGFPPNWTTPKELSGNKKLIDIDTLRYHAIGNAVSVPVISWIADRIKKAQALKNDKKGIKYLSEKFVDFSKQSSNVREQYFSELNERLLFEVESPKKIYWKTGGFAFSDKIIDSSVNNCPTMPFESNLIDMMDDGEVDEKYFISPSAATGILRRVNHQGRRLFAPLYESLKRLASKIPQGANT